MDQDEEQQQQQQDPLTNFARVLEPEADELDYEDRKVRDAWLDSGGDTEEFKEKLSQFGVSPETFVQVQQGLAAYQRAPGLNDAQREVAAQVADQHRANLLEIVHAGHPDTKQALWVRHVAEYGDAMRRLGYDGDLAYPGDDRLQSTANLLNFLADPRNVTVVDRTAFEIGKAGGYRKMDAEEPQNLGDYIRKRNQEASR